MRLFQDSSRRYALFGASKTLSRPPGQSPLPLAEETPRRSRTCTLPYARGDVFSAQVAQTVPRVALRRPFPGALFLPLRPLPLFPRPPGIPATPLDTTNHPPTYETGEAVANYATRSSVFFGVATWHRDGDPDFSPPFPTPSLTVALT